MLIFLAIIYNLSQPYWDILKKNLAHKGVSSLTILHSPNLIGHPVGILALILLGLFTLPTDPAFFLYWFGMVGFSAASLTLFIWGLLKTKFFAVQILSKLGFVTSSIAAVLLIGEHLSPPQVAALALGVIGICFFAWPENRHSTKLVVWDRGVLFVILSLILSGIDSVFYKMATFHVPDYTSFLSGRFVGDLIGWTAVWIISSFCFLRRNLAGELISCLKNQSGLIMIIGVATSTLLSSWLIYKLPLTTFAMLEILTIPAAYLFSRFLYKEKMTTRMWIGTIFVVGSVGIFLMESA